MPKKFKLDISFENEFILFGICSHIKDYRIVWHINKQLNFKFSKIEDFKFKINKQNIELPFSCYYYIDIANLSTYYFLSNLSISENKYLITPYNQANYLLYCEIPTQCKNSKNLLNEIRKTPNILTAFEIDQTTLPNQNQIISELEIHITNIKKSEKEKEKEKILNLFENYDK